MGMTFAASEYNGQQENGILKMPEPFAPKKK
jgi:hypothetical protein